MPVAPRPPAHAQRRVFPHLPAAAGGLTIAVLCAAPTLAAPGIPDDTALAPLRAAMATGEPDQLVQHVRLPFLFEGRREDRAGFVTRVAPQLFTPAVRRCLQRARPQLDGGRATLACAEYQFYLEKQQGRWRIAEFASDPEALADARPAPALPPQPPPTLPAGAPGLDEFRAALSRGDAARLAELLRAAGPSLPRGPRDESLLHLACSYHHAREQPALVRVLLAAGADPAARDAKGLTPLHWAAGFGCAECVRLLLAAKAPVDATSAAGRTPLFTATGEIVPLLLDAGADPRARDAEGNVPLHFNGHDALLAPGVNARNRAGLTPLHFAALGGDQDRVRWLLDRGADPALETTVPFEHREGVLAPAFDPAYRFEPGQRALDLVRWQHERVKWSTGRFRPALELLDAVTPRRGLLRR